MHRSAARSRHLRTEQDESEARPVDLLSRRCDPEMLEDLLRTQSAKVVGLAGGVKHPEVDERLRDLSARRDR